MSNGSATVVVILAAGQGTRMKSDTPKMLHAIGGHTVLEYALYAAKGVNPDEITVVVGRQREKAIDAIGTWASDTEHFGGVVIAHQEEQNGTGHTIQCALEHPELQNPDGTILVATSDVPLLDSEAFRALLEEHNRRPRVTVIVLTSTADNSHGYSRIVRNADGEVLRIVEEKDASDEGREITEVNSGAYAFDAGTLADALKRLDINNARGEFHLIDVIGITRKADRSVRGHRLADATVVAGINDRAQLAALGREFNRRTYEVAMRGGATIVDPDTTWIDVEVEVGRDVTILPGTQLHGRTTIGDGTTMRPDTTLTNMVVGKRVSVVRMHGSDSEVDEDATVGPFTYIRPNTKLGVGAKFGGFIEAKSVQIGNGLKVPYLIYVGDTEIGEHSNIGASSVFVNCGGVNKHRTVIDSHVRTGSDTMFTAPVTVGDGTYSGAGIVIKDDVPPGALAVGSGRQRNIERWVERKRPGTAAAKAAQAAQAADNNKEDQEGQAADDRPVD